MPKDLHLLEETLTQNSAMLTWARGFNGGSEQHFVLLFKEVSQITWGETPSIADTGPQIKYTLGDLLSDTAYEARVYASNIIGNSSFSNRFSFITKAEMGTSLQICVYRKIYI